MLAYQSVPPATSMLPLRLALAAGACVLASAACGDSPRPGSIIENEPALQAHTVNEPAIDKIPASTQTKVAAQGPERRANRKLGPQDALVVVEQSELEFIAPQRKGKEKVYTAREFADMLRTKWDWLGSDIEDLDSFIAEIASESFAAFEPYRVRHPDGREQDFANWLRSQLGSGAPAGGTTAKAGR